MEGISCCAGEIVTPSKEYNDYVHKYGIFDSSYKNQDSKSLGGAERHFIARAIFYTAPGATAR